jgi:hypothetical protein
MKNEEIENIHLKGKENIFIIQFKPNVKTPFKIIEYIALYANNIIIIDVLQIMKTTDSKTETYWRVFIKADQACFRNLQNYLEE